MDIIQNNPYRIVGLLVGASAKEQSKQINKLKMYLDAEQEPDGDFSFPSLGKIHRTHEKVSESASKLTLDSDKMNAALFWFYKDNDITDEAAFDAMKESDINEAFTIWSKLTSNGEVTKRNASAFSNLGTLYLSGALESLNINGSNFINGINYKLKFLESDFIKEFKTLATDDTYKTTKKELQLLFLDEVQSEIGKSGKIPTNKFIEIITKLEFLAKDDFLKSFVQKPIEEIEKKIKEAKNKHKIDKSNAIKIGKSLYDKTSENLKQLKSLLGELNVKYSTISDRVANEILQCSIDSFNYFQEIQSDTDYFKPAMELAKLAENVAVGKLTKDRIQDSLKTLEEMKEREILQAIEVLQSIKNTYEENKRKIKEQVKHIEQTDFDIKLGRKTINQKAVEDNIKNSLDWDKVNELIISVFTDNILNKIKESDNSKAKIEFVDLLNWLNENSSKSLAISKIINKYKSIPPKLTFSILSSVVTNTENKPIFSKYIRYIGLNLNIKVIEKKSVTFHLKYIKPDGSINRNQKNSPSGYTSLITHNLNLFTKSISLSGWGNSDKCTYSIGEHRIEVYVDEYMIHSKTFYVDFSPVEKLETELKKAEDKLSEIKNNQYFKSELDTLNSQMIKIKEWQFLRSQADKDRQIKDQQQIIDTLLDRANKEKSNQILKQQTIINELKSKIQQEEF